MLKKIKAATIMTFKYIDAVTISFFGGFFLFLLLKNFLLQVFLQKTIKTDLQIFLEFLFFLLGFYLFHVTVAGLLYSYHKKKGSLFNIFKIAYIKSFKLLKIEIFILLIYGIPFILLGGAVYYIGTSVYNVMSIFTIPFSRIVFIGVFFLMLICLYRFSLAPVIGFYNKGKIKKFLKVSKNILNFKHLLLFFLILIFIWVEMTLFQLLTIRFSTLVGNVFLDLFIFSFNLSIIMGITTSIFYLIYAKEVEGAINRTKKGGSLKDSEKNNEKKEDL
ncbi:MAG: hypothetical protein ACOCQR_01625 [bacterium]